MRISIAMGLLALGLAGCVTSEKVYLKNADGHTVTCGPYTAKGGLPQQEMMAQPKLRDCVADYQRQGYERVPNP